MSIFKFNHISKYAKHRDHFIYNNINNIHLIIINNFIIKSIYVFTLSLQNPNSLEYKDPIFFLLLIILSVLSFEKSLIKIISIFIFFVYFID